MSTQRLPRDPSPYKRLKALLEARGLSAADLASAIGVSRAAVYRSMAISSGLEHYWIMIARWQNISLDWLLAGKEGFAPVEFVETSGLAALKDTEVVTSGRIIGSLADSANKWPDSSSVSFTSVRGRLALRVVRKMRPELEPDDLLILESPFDEHVGDSRSMIGSGDIAAIQGKDGSFAVGRVKKDNKHGWFVLAGFDGKTTVWTDSDIHQAHRVISMDIGPRIDNSHEKPTISDSNDENVSQD